MLSKIFNASLVATLSYAVKLGCPEEGGCTITYYFPPEEECLPFRKYYEDEEMKEVAMRQAEKAVADWEIAYDTVLDEESRAAMTTATYEKFYEEIKAQNEAFNEDDWEEFTDNLVKEHATAEMAEAIVEDLEEAQAEEAGEDGEAAAEE